MQYTKCVCINIHKKEREPLTFINKLNKLTVEWRGDGGGGGVQYLKQIVIKHIQTYAKFN